MPAAFGGAEAEYLAATRHVACFDSSFRGRLLLQGRDGLDLLQRISTNDLQSLRPGESAGTILISEKGRLVDFVTLLHLGEEGILLITSPEKQTEVSSWIERFIILEDIKIWDLTSESVMISLIGPEAESTNTPRDSGAFPSPSDNEGGGIRRAVTRWRHATELHLISGPSAESPFRIWLQERILPEPRVQERASPGADEEAGERIPLIGSQAYEAYRITHGIPMAVSELNQNHNPYDVGLRPFISYTKGCYVGQEVIARLDTYQKARRHLAPLVFGRGERPSAAAKVTLGGEDVGHLTSSTDEPLFGSTLGLAVLAAEVPAGAVVECQTPSGSLQAAVGDFPVRLP
jgi:folate-binding protein YgfZ